ncbi:hypothetical protein C8J57DRAFT_1724231 [Mycena rebaudengoi]|nr:hypothetical protein C8J57DRAFT_1724231 [Mycena rebaudengoi]
MRTYLALPYILNLLHVVSAAPTIPVAQRADTSPVDPDVFFRTYFTINANCDRTSVRNGAKKRPMIEQAVKDAAEIVQEAQYIQRTDTAFTRYFSPDMIKGEEDEFQTVQNMFTVILKPPGKITLRCPLVNEELKCSRNLAVTGTVATDDPTISFCPGFFTDKETVPSLQSKPLSEKGWCTAPPHRLGQFMTGGHTVLHEMTHLSMIAVAAGLGDENDGCQSTEGTTDVLGRDDENAPLVKDTYAGGPMGYAPIAAIVLRQHWRHFFEQPGGRQGNLLAEPLVGTTENAESYAAAATETFFARKCAAFGFDPNQVLIEP